MGNTYTSIYHMHILDKKQAETIRVMDMNII